VKRSSLGFNLSSFGMRELTEPGADRLLAQTYDPAGPAGTAP
jgi:hypothetical protein